MELNHLSKNIIHTHKKNKLLYTLKKLDNNKRDNYPLEAIFLKNN